MSAFRSRIFYSRNQPDEVTALVVTNGAVGRGIDEASARTDLFERIFKYTFEHCGGNGEAVAGRERTGKTTFSARLSDAADEAINKYRKEMGFSRSEFIEYAIFNLLEEMEDGTHVVVKLGGDASGSGLAPASEEVPTDECN